MFTKLSTWLLITVLALAACGGETAPAPADCPPGQIHIAPTATRPSDPDLFSPPAPPAGADGATYCPTPVPAEIDDDALPAGFTTTAVVNLSLDEPGQELAAVAAGDDMLAVAWLVEDEIVLAISRGGNHFQTRPVDRGQAVSLAFSKANRLHVAYEQEGRILYRAADQGAHPADVAPIFVADGAAPQVVVDELSWAHVLYEQDGRIFKARHLSGEQWLTQFVAAGTRLAVRPFYNEIDLTLWGIPAGAYWFGLFTAALADGEVRLYRFLSWFNLWQEVARFPVPDGETVPGAVGLDFRAAGPEEAWVVAAWVTERPAATPPAPAYAQPLFEAVNPLFPDQIANPDQIHSGLNAARWHSRGAPFAAGLRQTVSVPDPAGTIAVEVWGRALAGPGADLALRVGIDPTGGQDPAAASVIWSPAAAPDAFARLTVSAPAAGAAATAFLQATQPVEGIPATAVWDTVAIQNGAPVNGGFEGPFAVQDDQDGLLVPAGWTAYYEDGGALPGGSRPVTTVYAAWSADGGATWSAPAAVTANRTPAAGTTGAIRPDVAPLIALETEPPSVTFTYVYERGDPPPGTTFLRFGRPHATRCVLGTDECTDPPGAPLLAPVVVRPTVRLVAAADPFDPTRAILAWDALQTDAAHRDVYATYLVLR